MRGISPIVLLFQSTLSRRERLILQSTSYRALLDFNPRSHEESDGETPTLNFHTNISIHALTKRATYCIGQFDNDSGISIHALTKRAT